MYKFALPIIIFTSFKRIHSDIYLLEYARVKLTADSNYRKSWNYICVLSVLYAYVYIENLGEWKE